MPQKYKETKFRTITKGIVLRIIVFTIITFAVFLITDSYTEGIEVGFLDIGIELFVHYVYERIWQRIGWGIVIKIRMIQLTHFIHYQDLKWIYNISSIHKDI